MGHHRPFQMPGEDDMSHELKPDGIAPTKKPPRNRKTKPAQSHPQPEEDTSSINKLDKPWTPIISTTLVSDQEQVQVDFKKNLAKILIKERN